MGNIRDQIKKSVSKRLSESKKSYPCILTEGKKTYLFEDVKYLNSTKLNEFVTQNPGYDYEESLNESLEDDPDLLGDQKRIYQVGDVVMTTNYISSSSGSQSSNPHRVLIVSVDTSAQDEGTITYQGFLISSKVDKSNKNNPRYPNNIYIEDVTTIYYRTKSMDHKEAFIRVDDLVEFTNRDMSDHGNWKGKASFSFINYVQNCVANIRRGVSNLNRYWSVNQDRKRVAENLTEAEESFIGVKLNPLLYDEDKLKPEIKDKIVEIVDAFLEYIQVDINVMDIRLVGSNAAYNYTEHSDLDIHIVTDMSKISDPETIARLYFDSVKREFKESYDIKIKGIDVEMYVEDINTSAVSNGIYSVTQDEWIKEPTPEQAPTPEDLEKSEEILSGIIVSIKQAKTVQDLQKIIDSIYILRKNSLSAQGETGAGNLAFKALRNKGILDKIRDTINADTAKSLSLESKDLRESCDPFKVGTTTYSRDKKYGVGKKMGKQLYFHKDYVDRVCPELYKKALPVIEGLGFKFNCLMYDESKPNQLRFDAAENFDKAREPVPGDLITVDTTDGSYKKGKTPQIWHHKWMWVLDDYKGFDVQAAYEWSKTWTQKIQHPSGYQAKWDAALKDAGLPLDK